MTWKVSLSDLNYGEEEVEAAVEVLRSRWLTMGAVTARFEQAFATYLGAHHALAATNGTAALHLACAGIGLGPGDEVIVPSLTFVATANAIMYTGATPIFADVIGPEDLTISPEDIEAKITPHTRAIMVMHYGGYPCQMDRILEIAHGNDLCVIEDAAHAPGAWIDGKKCGTLGDVGCFSFFSNKNLAVGEGGMVVTNRDDLAESMRLMRSHGMTTVTWDRHLGRAHSYDVVGLGFNYRIDETRAALGLAQLSKLDAGNSHREGIVLAYREALGNLPWLSIPFQEHVGSSSYHLFPILLAEGVNRAAFINHMHAQGIQTSVHYPPIHLFSYYQRRFGYEQGLLPVTENLCSREVTLPLDATITEEQVRWVIEAVRSWPG